MAAGRPCRAATQAVAAGAVAAAHLALRLLHRAAVVNESDASGLSFCIFPGSLCLFFFTNPFCTASLIGLKYPSAYFCLGDDMASAQCLHHAATVDDFLL